LALLTDLPALSEGTMYLKELQSRLLNMGIDGQIFTISTSKNLALLDGKSGLLRMIKAAMQLRKFCSYDLIHVQFTYPIGFALSILAQFQLMKTPLLIHTHGYDVFTVPEINYGLRRSNIGKFITMSTWKNANKIVVVCKKAYSELTNLGIQNVDLLYNGIDEKRFCRMDDKQIPSSVSALRENTDVIFLSVASVTPVKNHIRLIKAFTKSFEKYSKKMKIRLIMIGSQPLQMSNLQIPDGVLYMGRKTHQDLPFFYNISDSFILPSLSEAHPWSMLEAMSCELPIIASNVGGIPETTVDNSFLVDPYNIDNISRRIDEMIELGHSGRKSLGKRNRSIVLSKFTIGQHTQELVKIYKQVLKQ
jgi:teichuronic acid biosynthesis glycosyltransferase TuaC